MSAALLTTPLDSWHRAHKGRMVEFGGWSMPVQYGSIVEEHRAVRDRAGLFDISHMGRLTFHGEGVLPWLEMLTTNNVAKLAEWQVQYSLLLNDQGGVIDDILVYRSPQGYSIVCNASNRAPVVERIMSQQPHGAGMKDQTTGTAMIAPARPLSARDPAAAGEPGARAHALLPLRHRQGGRCEGRHQPHRLHG